MKNFIIILSIFLNTNIFSQELQKQKLIIVEYDAVKNDTTIVGDFENVFLNNKKYDKNGAYIETKMNKYQGLSTNLKLISIIGKDTITLTDNAELIEINIYDHNLMNDGPIVTTTFDNGVSDILFKIWILTIIILLIIMTFIISVQSIFKFKKKK